MLNSTLTKNQKKTFTKFYEEDGQRYKITATVRHDDECGNGYNTFAMTADIYKITNNNRQVWIAGGCQHEEMKTHFPELVKFTKWHLCGTDGPMHYITNTLYLAGNRDCWGKAPGEPKGYEKAIKFEGFPVNFKFKKDFIESLNGYNLKDLNLVKIYHAKEPNTYGAKYTFSCYFCEWYECPFATRDEAEEFLQAFKNIKFEIVETPTGYSEGKQREFDAARAAAIWPEATDEELSLPAEELKQKLIDRLPGLMADFKKDVEALGFVF